MFRGSTHVFTQRRTAHNGTVGIWVRVVVEWSHRPPHTTEYFSNEEMFIELLQDRAMHLSKEELSLIYEHTTDKVTTFYLCATTGILWERLCGQELYK